MLKKDLSNENIVNAINAHDKKLNQVQKDIIDIKLELHEHSKKLCVLDEIHTKIDFLYNAVDRFMKEIIESRDDRIFLNSRITDHEDRITGLEASTSTVKRPLIA